MRKTTMVVVMLLVACSGQKGETGPAGPRGETGATGAQGAQGERGADGAAIAGARISVWVDVNGNVIGPEAALIDDAGVKWVLDVETGSIATRTVQPLAFESDDCTGQPLVSAAVPPRTAFRAASDGGFFVRSDTVQGETPYLRSGVSLGSGCLPPSGGPTYVPLNSITGVEPPASPFTGPLRTEWR